MSKQMKAGQMKATQMKVMALVVAASGLVGASAMAGMDVPTIVSFSKAGQTQTYSELYTETGWMYIQLPESVISKLGGMAHLKLSVAGAPAFLTVSMNGKMKPLDRAVGLSISRSDTSKMVNQDIELTLTNTDTGQAYTFSESVLGDN